MGSLGVSHNSFLCREQQGWLLRRGGEGWALGRGVAGEGMGGLTLTCKVQLPHKLDCFLKSDIRINTQTQLHAHMRRRLCIPKGGDLGLLASELQGRSQPSLRSPLGCGESSGEGCLVSEVLSTSTQTTLNQIHASWVPRACASVCAPTACVLARGSWLSLPGLQGMGCRQRRVKGARGDVLSPTPRGPGLREGGGASLISRPPW